MTTKSFLRQYWRIFVVALLGALIAFSGSFLLEETYVSSTRLLIRGRSASFLTNTGQDLSGQPGVIDSSLAKTLAETQAGVATSREVATIVVDRLQLDAPKPEKSGPVAWTAGALATTYKCGRAFITHGFCRDPEPREKAIQDVQEGILAGQVGVKAGEGAGQPGGYVLELGGSGTSPEQARQITDTAADVLVQVSADRFRRDAQQHADQLNQQLGTANKALNDTAQAIAAYKTAHNLTSADELAVMGVANSQDVQTQLQQVKAELAGAQAELTSLNGSLASTPPRQQSNQDMTNGRSSTGLSTDAPNPAYNDLVVAREKQLGTVHQLEAKQAQLQAQMGSGGPTALNADQAGLLPLLQNLRAARDTQSKISQDYQTAVANAQSNTIELTRIDLASTPNYPMAPKRYLYLLLGLLIGGLAGGGLTWLARRRDVPGDPFDEDDEDDEDDDEHLDELDHVDLRNAPTAEQELEPVGGPATGERYGNGNGSHVGRGSTGSPTADGGRTGHQGAPESP